MNPRLRYEDLKPAQWTLEEARHHLTVTFDQCVKDYPDLMDVYVLMLVEAETREEEDGIMRRGLRDTITRRMGKTA
jgi:hypothetical protein